MIHHRPALCRARIKRRREGVWGVVLRVTMLSGRSIPIRDMEFPTYQQALLYACRSTGVR